MPALALDMGNIHEPTPEEMEEARAAARQLRRLDSGRHIRFTVEQGDDQEAISLPANIFKSVIKLLVEMGNGNAVTILPVQGELTTSQAAKLLNVSRPHIVKLLEEGKISFRRVGTHRKISVKDMIAHRDKSDAARRAALTRLAEIDEELGIADDDEALVEIEDKSAS